MNWLSLEQLVFLHDSLVKATGGTPGIRDNGLLQSALMSPMQTYDNEDLFPSVIEKCSRLAFGLTQFHPFLDGNKRIGAHALLISLELNNIKLEYTQKELSDIFIGLANGSVNYNSLCDWVKLHIKNQ